MRHLATPILAALLLVAPLNASANEWATLPSPKAFGGTRPSEMATQYLDRNEAALRLAGITLTPRLTMGRGRSKTVTLEQRYQGLRVVDRGAAVRIEDDAVSAVSLDVSRDLVAATTPGLNASEAAAKLSERLGRQVKVEAFELAVLGDGGGRTVWLLDVRDARGGSRFFVDASDGALVMRMPLAKDALGRVYEVSSAVTPVPKDFLLPTLDTVASPVVLNGWSGLLTVTNYVSGGEQSGYTVEQSLHPSSGFDFLYDPPLNPNDSHDAFAQVNLFYHLTNIRDYYTQLGVDPTGPKWKLTAVANGLENGLPLNNAFYSPMGIDGAFASPNLIMIGQGSAIDFSYDSDVFKHEFGHYIESNTVNYDLGPFYSNVYGLQPLDAALDEGLADYFACSNNNSAVLGEAALAPFGAERDLTDTHKHCPEDVRGESHADGELIGSLTWTLRTDLGQARGDELVWGGVGMLTPGADFDAFAKALTNKAMAMAAANVITAAELAQVKSEIAGRGLDDCGRVLAIGDGQARSLTVVGLDLLGQLLGGSCGQLQGFALAGQGTFHLSRTTLPTDSAVHFHLEMNADSPGDLDYQVVIRKGSPVSFKADPNTGFAAATGLDQLIPSTSDTEDVVIDGSSTPPFEPGATYYLVVTNTTCSSAKLTISADNIVPPPPKTSSSSSSKSASSSSSTGSGGGPSELRIDRGCGCIAAGSDATPWSDGRVGVLTLMSIGVLRLRRGRARRSSPVERARRSRAGS